jgi:ATP-dependent protease HslVU (ClpYQ) peptidase subunit
MVAATEVVVGPVMGGALLAHTALSATDIVKQAMTIAGDLCISTAALEASK